MYLRLKETKTACHSLVARWFVADIYVSPFKGDENTLGGQKSNIFSFDIYISPFKGDENACL